MTEFHFVINELMDKKMHLTKKMYAFSSYKILVKTVLFQVPCMGTIFDNYLIFCSFFRIFSLYKFNEIFIYRLSNLV